MKLLFGESGALLARYGDMSNSPFAVEPVAQPGQTLMEVPEGVIGEAVVGLSEGELVLDETIISAEWRNIREMRNRRLAETDWICSITDYEVPNKGAWIVYRQALRDITRVGNPFAVVWPVVEVETAATGGPSPHPSTDVSSEVASVSPEARVAGDAASSEVPAVASSEVGDAPSM